MNSGILLDASALLCVINEENGADLVKQHLAEARISSVNFSEVVSKLVDLGMSEAEAGQRLRELELEIVPFDEGLALAAGYLRSVTREHGLSLGDRACLATARARSARVLTSDRAWGRVAMPLSLDIILVR